jgi:hypothetical protein
VLVVLVVVALVVQLTLSKELLVQQTLAVVAVVVVVAEQLNQAAMVVLVLLLFVTSVLNEVLVGQLQAQAVTPTIHSLLQEATQHESFRKSRKRNRHSGYCCRAGRY